MPRHELKGGIPDTIHWRAERRALEKALLRVKREPWLISLKGGMPIKHNRV